MISSGDHAINLHYLPYGMSKADGATMNIHFVIAQIQKLHVREHYDAECFIDLPQIDVLRTETKLTLNKTNGQLKVLLVQVRLYPLHLSSSLPHFNFNFKPISVIFAYLMRVPKIIRQLKFAFISKIHF